MATSKIQPDSLQLQPRDFALLSGLFESRIMTGSHIAALYFHGKRPYTTKRLQKIKAAGLIGERKRTANERSILFLTRKGFNLLNSHGYLSDYPLMSGNSFEARASVSEITLRHELEIMDVKAAFHAALAKSEEFALSVFWTWPLLYQFESTRQGSGKDTPMRPDGFIRMRERKEGGENSPYDCFLEVDRSHEDQAVLVGKAVSYLNYYKSGEFAVRNGGSRSNFNKFPFRVLMVFKSAERRNNTAERLAQNNPPILRQTWLTTFAEVTTDPLGPIWILPGDFREMTRGTTFYNERPNRRFEFRRQREREAFVEGKIKKWRLFEQPPPSSIQPQTAATDDSNRHQ